MRLAKNDVTVHLNAYAIAHRQQIIASLENWWDKYSVPLRQIESERDNAVAKLTSFFRDLGYE